MKSKNLNNQSPDPNIFIPNIHKITKEKFENLNVETNGKFNSSGNVIFYLIELVRDSKINDYKFKE